MHAIQGPGLRAPQKSPNGAVRFSARQHHKDYAFFSDRDSAYHQLAERMRGQNSGHPLMEPLLRAVVQARHPEQTAATLLEKYGEALERQPLEEVFPGLEPLLQKAGAKGLDENALAVLELMSLLAGQNDTPAGRKLIRGFVQALVQKPNAGTIARNILARFEAEMAENPFSRLALKVRRFVQEKHHIELLGMEDFLTAAGELGLEEERRLLVELIQAEGAAPRPDARIVDLAVGKLLDGLEKEAAFQADRQPDAFFESQLGPGGEKNRADALKAIRLAWKQKQKAALTLGLLETLRQQKAQPPANLLSPLLETVENATSRNAFYRGKGIPARYPGPVFDAPWEARYVKAILPFNWSSDYAIDLLEHHPLDGEIGQAAQHHLLRLLNEPAFEWDFTHEGGAVEAIETLGRLVRAVLRHPGAEHSLIYPAVRQKLLNLTDPGQPPGRSSSLLGAPHIAKLVVETWLAQWPPGETLPDDLMQPLVSRAALYQEAPPASQEALPQPKPRPVYKEYPSPAASKKRRRRFPSLLDILLGRG